MAIRC